MTKKSTPIASSSPVNIVVTADDGGVGKTTVAVQIATGFKLAEMPLDLYQLDSKGKLAAKTGLPVVSLSVSDGHGERGDELTPSDIIAPWYRAATDTQSSGRSNLLEVGGATAGLFHAGATDLDIQEDIEALGLHFLVFVLVKAGEDSAIQMLREIRRLEKNLPGASIVIVRNEVLGCPIVSADFLADSLKRPFLASLEKYASIRLPRVRPRSMAMYERLHVTPDVVVSWHANNYAEAIARTGRPRDEAKIFVKDVAAWSGTFQDELLRVLPILTGGTNA